MASSDLRDQFRQDVVDVELPVLWSDQEIYAYIDDAQKMFCRLTGGLGDGSTVAITQLPIAPAGEWVTLSPLILKIRSAYRVSNGCPLEVINYEDMSLLGVRFDGKSGPALRIVLGIEPGKVRLHPKPNDTDTIQLIVDRLPLIDINDDDQVIEVAKQHQIHLLMWAKHLAYEKQDAETFDKKKAADFEMQFRSYCVAAVAEKDRAKHKTRIVAYGGI